MDMPFVPAKQYLSKLTASHFGTLNTKIANQNVLKRILITMHNENKADCNHITSGYVQMNPYHLCTSSRLQLTCGDRVITIISLVLVQFGLIKFKTKAKYISISNILHLLSAPASIPHVGAVLASLVVVSPSNCKFPVISNFHLIVDSCFHPSRALTKSLESLIPSTWTYFC